MGFDVEKYPPAVRELLVPEHPVALDAARRTNRLGPSSPRSTAPTLRPPQLADAKMADCCLAAFGCCTTSCTSRTS